MGKLNSYTDMRSHPIMEIVKQNELRLFFWHELILEEGNYTICAIAKSLTDAKPIAIKRAPLDIRQKLERHLNQLDSIVLKCNHLSSFIYKS